MRALHLVVPAVCGIFATVAFASPAFAVCDVKGEIFYLHKNDVSRNTAKTDMHGCDLHFISAGKINFRSAAVVAKPKNGSLRKIAHLEFRYRPKPGFKGNDAFSVKVCGKTPNGSGCSTLHYDAAVE
ncbi:MAG: hypothetical protein QOJ96_150 [Alphaproteobacteria bacterium]|jgi:hypothetical protein|nr:hypothetical protein [Alphaproteobacteria bacterium]